jgi:hypothetical protein
MKLGNAANLIILTENLHENIQKAKEFILSAHPNTDKKEINRILEIIEKTGMKNEIDSVMKMAKWYVEEKDRENFDLEEVFTNIKLRKNLKDFPFSTANARNFTKAREMLRTKIKHMDNYHGTKKGTNIFSLYNWNRIAEKMLDIEDGGLSMGDIDVYESHGKYDMYKIDRINQLFVPYIENVCPWCITRAEYFNMEEHELPYYMIINRENMHPVAMIVPSLIQKGIEEKDYKTKIEFMSEGFRNSRNNGMIDVDTMREIHPLVKKITDYDPYDDLKENEVDYVYNKFKKGEVSFGENENFDEILSRDISRSLSLSIALKKRFIKFEDAYLMKDHGFFQGEKENQDLIENSADIMIYIDLFSENNDFIKKIVSGESSLSIKCIAYTSYFSNKKKRSSEIEHLILKKMKSAKHDTFSESITFLMDLMINNGAPKNSRLELFEMEAYKRNLWKYYLTQLKENMDEDKIPTKPYDGEYELDY